MANVWTLLLAILVLEFAACTPASKQPSFEINAPECRANLKQICQVYFELPDEYLAVAHLDSVSMQRAPEQIEIFFPGPPAIVWCTYDKLKRQVVSAGLGQEEPLTDAQIADARSKGFCTEDAAQLRQAMIREQEKRLKSGPGGRTGTFIQPLNPESTLN